MTEQQNVSGNSENSGNSDTPQPGGKSGGKWKWTKRIALIGVGLVVVVIVAILLLLEPIARRTVEIGAEMALGVETTLESVELSIFSGQYQLSGLTIANPEGFDLDSFVDLKNVSVNIEPGSVLNKDIRVPRVEITGLHMNLEKKDKRENYKVIMDNLKAFTSRGQAAEEEGDEPAEAEGVKFAIENIVLRDVSVKTRGLMIGDKGKNAPPLHFDEIVLKEANSDSRKGMVAAQFMDKILVAVLTASAEHGVTAVSGAIGEGVGGAVKITTGAGDTVIQGVGGLLGGKKKQDKAETQAAEDKVEEKASSAGEAEEKDQKVEEEK